MMKGLNIGLELQKIRGGSMINDINMHMNLKIACMPAKADDPKCKWINGNKYYIYSAVSCMGYPAWILPEISSATA